MRRLRLRGWRLAALLLLVALILAVLLANAFESATLASFVDTRVINDTGRAIRVTGCWDPACRTTKYMPTDTIAPGGSRDEALWNNSDAGTAAMRFVSSGRVIGCVVFRYRKGQAHAVVHAREARRCRAGTAAQEFVHPVNDY